MRIREQFGCTALPFYIVLTHFCGDFAVSARLLVRRRWFWRMSVEGATVGATVTTVVVAYLLTRTSRRPKLHKQVPTAF